MFVLVSRDPSSRAYDGYVRDIENCKWEHKSELSSKINYEQMSNFPRKNINIKTLLCDTHSYCNQTYKGNKSPIT